MFDGSYVFFVPEHLPPANVKTPWVLGDSMDVVAKTSFRKIIQVKIIKNKCI